MASVAEVCKPKDEGLDAASCREATKELKERSQANKRMLLFEGKSQTEQERKESIAKLCPANCKYTPGVPPGTATGLGMTRYDPALIRDREVKQQPAVANQK